jgi:hypothetical protein
VMLIGNLAFVSPAIVRAILSRSGENREVAEVARLRGA